MRYQHNCNLIEPREDIRFFVVPKNLELGVQHTPDKVNKGLRDEISEMEQTCRSPHVKVCFNWRILRAYGQSGVLGLRTFPLLSLPPATNGKMVDLVSFLKTRQR
jgi:hypothetical protein